MRIAAIAALVGALAIASPLFAGTPTLTNYPNTFTTSDGSVAAPAKECGDGDTCATINLSDKSVITIVNEGSKFCEPYKLSFVKTLNGTVIAHWEVTAYGSGAKRCNAGVSGEWVLDQGLLHVHLSQNRDGSISAGFYGQGSPTPAAASGPMQQPAQQKGASPSPSP